MSAESWNLKFETENCPWGEKSRERNKIKARMKDDDEQVKKHQPEKPDFFSFSGSFSSGFSVLHDSSRKSNFSPAFHMS
jgi:hypothetical protein